MPEFHYGKGHEAPVVFHEDGKRVWLGRMFHLICGRCGGGVGPRRARGLFTIRTASREYVSDELLLVSARFEEESTRVEWRSPDHAFRVESRWEFSSEIGLCRRLDSIQNTSGGQITVARYVSRFVFSPGNYEVYSQAGRWCNENQGVSQPLGHGGLHLGGVGGRSCEGATPYLCLREADSKQAVAFHLIPRGDWSIAVRCEPGGGNALPYAVIEAGLGDQAWQLGLAPNETLNLPEILIQALPDGQPHLGAPSLHLYACARALPLPAEAAPVVYNTWFDRFDHLEPLRLESQLSAARDVGCEVFVVDAGWFGAGPIGWYNQVGDWREKTDAAFQGRMREFADGVRQAGLGFGLWMEPERFRRSTTGACSGNSTRARSC